MDGTPVPGDVQAAVWTEVGYDERHEKWRTMLFCQYKELVEAATKLSVTENKRKGERFRPGTIVSSVFRVTGSSCTSVWFGVLLGF